MSESPSREFSLRIDEYLKGQELIRFSLTKSAFIRNATFLAVVLSLVGFAMLLRGLFAWTLGFWLGSLFFLWIRFGWKRGATRAAKNNPDLLGPFVATMREDGLSVESPRGAISLPWKTLRGTESQDLFVLSAPSGEHVILPKLAFCEGVFWDVLTQSRYYVNANAGLRRRYSRIAVSAAQVGFIVIGLLLFAGDFDFFARLRGLRSPVSPFHFLMSYLPKPSPAPADQLQGEGPLYLVPIGDAASWLPRDLVESYRKKYGIDLQVLSPLEVPNWARDPVRKQLIAEELVEAMRYAYPEAETNGVLIAFTTEDMYISALWWEYAMNYRQEGRFGVISTARLALPGEEAAEEKVVARFRKLLTKNLGLLYYKMSFSGNPYSVLAGNIMAPADLDLMIEDFSNADVGSQGTLFFNDDDPCITFHHHVSETTARPGRAFLFPCRSASRALDVEVFAVDLRYGLFMNRRTEFSFPDSIPLEFSRVVRNLDDRPRALGIGGNHNLNTFPVGNMFPFTWMDLLLEDGSRVHYNRANLGFGYWDALHRERDGGGGGEYSDSTIVWNFPGWKIQTESGREYLFPPAYDGPPEAFSLIGIRDKDARLTMERNDKGHLLVARSPSGKELRFTYDDMNRIQRVQASDGEWREYRYDSKSYLSQAISPNHNTEYRRDGRTLSIVHNTEPVLYGVFDESDRMVEFRLPRGESYRFEYGKPGEKGASRVTVFDSKGPLVEFHLPEEGYIAKYLR